MSMRVSSLFASPSPTFSPFFPTIFRHPLLLVNNAHSERLTQRHYCNPTRIDLGKVKLNLFFHNIWWWFAKMAIYYSQVFSQSSDRRDRICKNVIEQVANVSNESKNAPCQRRYVERAVNLSRSKRNLSEAWGPIKDSSVAAIGHNVKAACYN